MLTQEWDMGKALDIRFMEGEEKGRKEGRSEGRSEGRDYEKITIARRLLANGMSLEDVAKNTELSIEKVKTLVRIQ